ncbi:HNH endonuclease [Streptococcus suis]
MTAKRTKYLKGKDYAVGLTSRGYIFEFSLEDWELVTKWSWSVDPRGYLAATVNNCHKTLHNYLMNPSKGFVVDHVNGNKLDNRRTNLRICTPHQNSFNSCVSKNNKLGVKGVSLTPHGRYRARIMVNRKEIRLGHFEKIEDAITARKKAEKKYFGEYARNLNRGSIMTKAEAIEFLTEQRDLRLVGYDDSKPAESDFDRWQLAQAEMFQKVIDWLEEIDEINK